MPADQLQDQRARDTGQRIAASPDYKGAFDEVGKYATKLQESSPVGGMKEDAEAKMKALFEYDRQLEGKYDPFAGQRSEMYGSSVVGHAGDIYGAASRNVSAQAGGVGDLFSAIGQYKHLEGTQLNQALNTVLSLLERQEKRKEKEMDMLWEREKFEREMALKEREFAKGTPTEQAQNLLDQVASDAGSGVVLDDLMRKYGTRVDPAEILRVYNTYSTWGPAKETAEQIYQRYGVTPPARAPGQIDVNDPVVQGYVKKLQSGEIKLTNVPTDKRDAVVLAMASVPMSSEEIKTKNDIVKKLQEYKDLISKRTLGGIIPKSPDKGKIEALRKLLGMQIARLYEKGRMSDEDRDYYLGLLPTAADAIASPEYATATLDQLVSMLNVNYGEDMSNLDSVGVGSNAGSYSIGRFRVEVE
jgi:hypothetical protein